MKYLLILCACLVAGTVSAAGPPDLIVNLTSSQTQAFSSLAQKPYTIVGMAGDIVSLTLLETSLADGGLAQMQFAGIEGNNDYSQAFLTSNFQPSSPLESFALTPSVRSTTIGTVTLTSLQPGVYPLHFVVTQKPTSSVERWVLRRVLPITVRVAATKDERNRLLQGDGLEVEYQAYGDDTVFLSGDSTSIPLIANPLPQPLEAVPNNEYVVPEDDSAEGPETEGVRRRGYFWGGLMLVSGLAAFVLVLLRRPKIQV
jgi:hypothetical protein